MQNDNVLTAEARATIMDACQSISRSADALKDCHTIDGDWGDDVDAKAFYEAELRLLKRLTALLAHPGQPVADDAAVRGDERAKRKAFTAVFLDVTTDEASEIVNHPKWSAGSWSHALDDRDAARAELARATSSQAHPGQPEPRECRHCGWMCIPNSTPSTTHYPLPQPEPSGEVMAFTTTVGRLLATAPHFEECETPEPCLSALIHRYYENYFDREKGREYAELYIAALYEAARAQGGEKS